MKRYGRVNHPVLVWLCALTLGFGVTAVPFVTGNTAVAKDPKDKKQDGLRVDDLPKPIPSFMKTIRGVGNRVGKEISKATSEGAKAVKKAIKKGQTEGGQKSKR